MSQTGTTNSAEKAADNRGFIMAVALPIGLVMGMLYAFSIFIIPLEETFGWARHQTTMTASLTLVFFSVGMLTCGNVMALIGPGKTASLGGLLTAAGFFLASFTPNLYILYLGYGVIGGYGIGLANIVPTAALLRWFPDKKGAVTGLVTMCLALGTFFLGTKLAGGLVGVYGWAVTFRVIAVIFLVVIAGGGLLLKFPPPGYAPPNWTPPAGQAEMWGYNRPGTLKTTACWLFFLWLVCIQLGGLMVITHVAPFAEEQGASKSLAATAMGVYAIANGIGRLFFGWSHDRFGLRPVLVMDSLFMVGGLAGMIYLFGAFGYAGLIISICLVGMSYGGTVAMTALVSNGFFGPKFFAKVFGMFTISVMIGGLVGPSLGGYIKTMTGSYTAAIMSAASLAVLSVVVSVVLKPPPRPTDEA